MKHARARLGSMPRLPRRDDRKTRRRWACEQRRAARVNLAELAADFPGASRALYYSHDGRELLVVATMRVPHRPGFLGIVARMAFDTYGARALMMLKAQRLGRDFPNILPDGRRASVVAITPTGKALSVRLLCEAP